MTTRKEQAVVDTGRGSDSSYSVYILRCSDETLYTGITSDVPRRVAEHNGSAKGARYTRSRRPVRLVYQESCPSRSAALAREAAIKKLCRSDKLVLVAERR